MGRSNFIFFMVEAMDVASNNPIHIGIDLPSFSDFKTIIGVFDFGSIVMPSMLTL
jgi:hypothetical protein